MRRSLRAVTRVLLILAGVVLLPSVARAQASITGTVKDSSGAVLPGVTVEASSPALIEKVRTAVTDGAGQYRIVDLRPGAYTLTLTLTGFNTVKREGIELAGSFTATVNAELAVGAVSETVTVAGQAPIVDVQSATRQETVSNNLLTTLPSSRSFHQIAYLVPGITLSTTTDVGGLAGPFSPTFGIHGGPTTEGRLLVDGLSVGASLGGSGVSGYPSDTGNSQEVTVTTSGGLGESEVGGPLINIVPKTGGNAFSGQFFATGTSGALQSSNYTQSLQTAGLRAPSELRRLWDVNGSVGGPVVKDKLWFFGVARDQGRRVTVPGMFYNANAGNPNAWTYVPITTEQAQNDGSYKNGSVRLTLQPTPRNKFNLFWDEYSICQSCTYGGAATTAPEASTTSFNSSPSRVQQIVWSSPRTNRLLLEAGLGTVLIRYGFGVPGDANLNLIPVTDQGGSIPGLTYRGLSRVETAWIGAFTWRGSVSYVTGAHNLKVGYQGAFYVDDEQYSLNSQNLAYRFNNGVPNQISEFTYPYLISNRTQWTGAYAQDQWTLKRLTLQGALRYDYASSYFPAEQIGPTASIPTAITFPQTQGVTGFNDIGPRIAAAYDLFGNGRTALKANIGKYLAAASNYNQYTATNPLTRIATSTTRSWTDANGNFIPDCNLLNPAKNGECGPSSNVNFGTSTFASGYDPALLSGWGVRPSDWDLGVSVQQQVNTRVSVEVAYNRRSFEHFIVTDNLAVAPSDFTKYSITAPVDPRLPQGGGYTISALYDVNPPKFGLTNNFVTSASNYGQQYQYWHGVDVTADVRQLANGLTVKGGLSTGQMVADNCAIVSQLPESLLGMASLSVANAGVLLPAQDCHLTSGFLTQVRGLASYEVPKLAVQLSGTFQSNPGPQLAANDVLPNALVAPALGRNLSGNAANVTVNLIQPGTLYGNRINQLDLRVGKNLVFGRVRTLVALDLFNVLNSAAVLTYNQTFGPAWLTPTSVLAARFAKISAQINF